jgi:hypothetical protein
MHIYLYIWDPIQVMPRLPGFQPKNHYEDISALTMSDARSVIKNQTTIALTHCVATTTNKTYSSALKSWVRVAEIFHYPVSCIQPYSATSATTAIARKPHPVYQLAMRCLQAITKVDTGNLFTWDC